MHAYSCLTSVNQKSGVFFPGVFIQKNLSFICEQIRVPEMNIYLQLHIFGGQQIKSYFLTFIR